MPKRRWRKSGFRSGLEKRVKDDLEKRKVKFGYEDTILTYTLPETKHKYTPDFTIYSNGKVLFIESKGYLDSSARRKMVAVKLEHPDKDIRILFQRDQPIRKGAKTTYGQWATKAGFIFAFGDKVPQEWLEELDTDE